MGTELQFHIEPYEIHSQQRSALGNRALIRAR